MSSCARGSLLLLLSLAGATGCGAGRPRGTPLPPGVVEAEQSRQRELALADLEHHQRRLDSIAYPLLARATSLCPGAVGYRLGLRVATLHDYEEPWRAAAVSTLRLGDTLAVLSLVRDGPAGDAGLEPGDRLLGVNGRALPVGATAVAAFRQSLAAARAAGGGQISLGYRRGAQSREATIALVPGCDYGVHVLVGGELNAYADGQNVFVTSTMMRFTDDDELRVIVAHELAHNARGHIGARQRSALLRVPTASGVGTGGYRTSEGAKAAAPSFPLETEREADYVGLYTLAMAGFPLDPAPRFWRHVAQADPEGIGMAATHPTPAERFLRMEQAIAEIERKRADGLPLVPDRPTVAAAPPQARPEPAATAGPPEVPPARRPARPPTDGEGGDAPVAGRVRTAAELQIDQGMRETLRDILRLRIAEAYEEVEPGLLVVALSPQAFTLSSTEYNLKQLYLAYDRATLWPRLVALELWQGGRAIGRYTRTGLLLDPEAGTGAGPR